MKTLVICSGGLDSVSMALLHKNDDLSLLTFNYGQKATDEIRVVRWLANHLNAKEFIESDISSLKWIFGKDNQLTNDNVNVEGSYKDSVVVPLRNGVFLEMALAYGYSYGFDKIVLGSHLDDCVPNPDGDYSFPDCTPQFFKAMQTAAEVGTLKNQKKVEIVSASTMGLHKYDLIRKAYEIDPEALFKSWSCYKNGEKQCGVCDSCMNRKNAFKKIGIEDKTEYFN